MKIQTLSLAFVIAFTQGTWVSNRNITSGVYHEFLGHSRVAAHTWDLVSTIDLYYIDLHTWELVSIPQVKEIHNYCLNRYNWSSCDIATEIYNNQQKQGKKILQYIDQIGTLLNKRTKFTSLPSSLISLGFDGPQVYSLHGTLTRKESERYLNAARKLQHGPLKSKTIIDDDIQVARSQLDILAEEIQNSIVKSKSINSKIIKDQISLFNHSNFTKEQYLSSTERIVANYHQITATYIDYLEKIILSIMFGSLGLIHPEVLPSAYFQEIITFYKENQPSYQPPVPADYNNVAELAKISQNVIEYQRKKLLITMRIPLPEPEKYKLYQLHTYPINLNKILQPTTDYILISKDQGTYRLIDNLNQCIQSQQYYICTSNYPVYNLTSRPICEAQSLIEPTSTFYCNWKILQNHDSYWKKLSNSNQWIYSLTIKQQIKLICKNEPITSIELIGTGIISFNPQCWIQTSSLILKGTTRTNSYAAFAEQPNTTQVIQQLSNVDEINIQLQQLQDLQNSLIICIAIISITTIIIISYLSIPYCLKCFTIKSKVNRPNRVNVEPIYDTPRPIAERVYFRFNADVDNVPMDNVCNNETQPTINESSTLD